MKKNNNNSFFSGLKLYSNVYKAGVMVELSNAKHLLALLKNVGNRIGILTLLSGRETNRFTLIHNFGVHLIKLNRLHGPNFVIKYLKASQLAIQKKIAGLPLKTLRELEPDLPLPRLINGLPFIIKKNDRQSIRVNSVRIIRFWLSLFSIYRILKMDFKPKLNTITDPFNGNSERLMIFNTWLESNSIQLLNNFNWSLSLTKLTPDRLLPIQKSSSLGPRSWTTLIPSYLLFKQDPWLNSVLREYLQLVKGEYFISIFNNIEFALSKFPTTWLWRFCKNQNLGRLAFKEEAAGKLRVFAMVDVITQSLLKPLHDCLFDLFRLLPNDGTHDQERAFDLGQELSKKYGGSFGFDLSSATDRLPLSSQISLLNSLSKSNLGDLWAKLLIGREYVIPKNTYGISEGSLRYSVGQPMGALSSWAMLDLIHHMMVQYCYRLSVNPLFKGWYSDYVIIGDDINLFDKRVADTYLGLCKDMGVEINLSKSVIATKPALEFAKRTGLYGQDVSALSFKDFISNNNFFGRLSIISRLIRRKYGKDLWKLFLLSNKSKSSKFADLRYPIIGYLSQIAAKSKPGDSFDLSRLLSLISNKNYPLSYFGRKINWLKPDILIKFMKGILNKSNLDKLSNYTDRRWSAINENAYKIILIDRILKLSRVLKEFDPLKYGFLYREFAGNSELETKFYKDRMERNLPEGLDLKTPLEKRPYFKEFIKLSSLDKSTHLMNRIFMYFLDPKIFKNDIVNLKHLFQGMTVDLSRPRILSEQVWVNLALPGASDMKSFVKTEYFSNLKLSVLLDYYKRFESLATDLNLHKVEVEKRELIDNPLKVLDFIKDSQSDKYKNLVKNKPDFMKFEDQIVSTEWSPIDMKPGFKPKFNFRVTR